MSGIRITPFGAATMPLSKIIPDGNFDIRPYGITAAFARAPYRSIDWETKELEWGDVPASKSVYLGKTIGLSEPGTNVPVMSWTTPAGAAYRWTLHLDTYCRFKRSPIEVTVEVNEAVTETFQVEANIAISKTLNLPPSATVSVFASTPNSDYRRIEPNSYYQCTGIVVGPKTFDLTEKWLALGIDMKGLDASVRIQGVEIPYSDYSMYFPLAPTELIIPGNWISTQERPVIEVYT